MFTTFPAMEGTGSVGCLPRSQRRKILEEGVFTTFTAMEDTGGLVFSTFLAMEDTGG